MGLISQLAALIAAALSRQLVDEFKAWTPWMANALVRCAVLNLDEDKRTRFKEEWMADMAETPGEIGKLVKGFGFLWAALCISGRTSWTRMEGNSQRPMDILVSSLLLIIASPTLLVTMVAIKLETGGPVIVRTRRRSRRGVFWLYQLNAERGISGQFARDLDVKEVPRLVNVLLGDMTLFRPRPKNEE